MSGWPWMKGKLVAIANARVSSNPDEGDPRPILQHLLYEYRPLIDAMGRSLRKKAVDGYDPKKHDDLWLLRFLLSHKSNPQKAFDAAKTTLSFRQEYKLDKLGDIREYPPQEYQKFPNDRKFSAFCRFMRHFVKNDQGYTASYDEDEYQNEDLDETATPPLICVVPDPIHLGVLTYVNLGQIDTHRLAELEEEDWIAGLAYINEYNFQWLDYLSRTTGRLTKAIRLVDVSTATIGQVDLTCQQKYTQSTRSMQDCFPQAIESVFMCFAPFWIQAPWRVIRPFLPERVVEKMDFLHPTSNDDDRQELLSRIPERHLSIVFGGTNPSHLSNRTSSFKNANANDDDDDDDFHDADEEQSLGDDMNAPQPLTAKKTSFRIEDFDDSFASTHHSRSSKKQSSFRIDDFDDSFASTHHNISSNELLNNSNSSLNSPHLARKIRIMEKLPSARGLPQI